MLWNVARERTAYLPSRWPSHYVDPSGFVGDVPGKLRRRHGKHRATEIGQPRLDFRIGKARVDLPVEPSITSAGVFLGTATPTQALASKLGRASPSVGTFGSCRRGPRSHRQRPQPARPDVLDRRRQIANAACTGPPSNR